MEYDYLVTDTALLECPICAELFNNPFETACGHCFCELCIYQCLERENICPICRENPSPVHLSFTLRRIIDDYRKKNNLTREQVSFPTAEEEKQKGNSYFQQGKYALSIKHYSQAIQATPTAVGYGNRALCYFKLKQYRLAISDCNKAIELDPKYVKPYIRKGVSLEQLREYEQAHEFLQKAKSLDTKRAFAQEIDMALQRITPFVKISRQQGAQHQSSDQQRNPSNARQQPPQQQQQHSPVRDIFSSFTDWLNN
jgi:tetratricopeptide (TPR) repeat protein